MEWYRSVVITGGHGMLARELAGALRRRGVEAVAVGHRDCDITDRESVNRLFETHRPSLLLNCAAHTGVDLCEDEPDRANLINGTGVGYLAEAAKTWSTKIIHFSTDFVFDGQNDRPYPTDHPTLPLSAYGRSKLLGETEIQHIAPPAWIIIRTAWLFGRHGNCFPKIIADRGRTGQPLKVVNDQRGCPTYAEDLAYATLNLIDHGANGIWHITNSGPTNWYEFAKAVLSEFKIETSLTPISTLEWVVMRPKQAKRPAYSVLDIEPYQRLTGKKLRDWREALRDYRTAVQI